MTFKPIEIVNVKYFLGDEILTMGRLAINNRKIYFEYDAETRLKPEVIYSEIFDPDAAETERQSIVFMWG